MDKKKRLEKVYVEVDAHFGESGVPIPSSIMVPEREGEKKFEIERVVDIQPGCCMEIGVSGLVYRVKIPVGNGRVEETKIYCEPVVGKRYEMRWCVAKKL